jgi:hypothetical protein
MDPRGVAWLWMATVLHSQAISAFPVEVNLIEALTETHICAGEASLEPRAEVIAAMRAALGCLSAMAARSERLRRWHAGLAKREQWQADADTAATSILLALQPMAMRAVATKDSSSGAAIFEAIRPFLLPESAGARLWWAVGNSHQHGFNSDDVVGAAVNVGASLAMHSGMMTTAVMRGGGGGSTGALLLQGAARYFMIRTSAATEMPLRFR